jgi:hypothetical protein
MQAYCGAMGYFLDRGVPIVIVILVAMGLLLGLKIVAPQWVLDVVLASAFISGSWTIGRMWYVLERQKRLQAKRQ